MVFFCTCYEKENKNIKKKPFVKKIEANSCLSIFGKNSKIQNGRHFWEKENFFKIAKSTFLR